jgi:hypothetical protein
MAIPILRRPLPGTAAAVDAARPRADEMSTTQLLATTRRWHIAPGLLIFLGLAVVAVLSRIYTTNSLAGEPTSDEYLYAVHARDLARAWAAGQAPSILNFGVEGRSVAFVSAALSLLISWDPLMIGRTVQALLNALCVPMTYVLARQVSLPRSAALAGAVLLMAVPEFQELAWRFWTDSQATLLALVYMSAVVAFVRRPSVFSALLALVSLAGLVVTKESAAVAFAPFLSLGVIPLSRRVTRSLRTYALVAGGLVALVVIGLTVLLSTAPRILATSPLLQKTFGAGPLILSSVREAIPEVPDYSEQLTQIIGPRELGTAFVLATVVGFGWLLAQTGLALFAARPRFGLWVLGWLAATVTWLVGISVSARDVGLLRQPADAWVIIGAGVLMAAIGTIALHLRGSQRSGWGMALLGLVVAAVLAERLIIVVTPKVAAAALTFRNFMPIVPLFAVLAGGGFWAAAGAVSLLAPSIRHTRAALAVAASAAVLLFWSPILHERLSREPLLGRVADRGANPETPQGLRVESFVEAEGWLRENLRPDDLTLVGPGILRHVAWYADLGVDGMESLIDVNSQPRTDEQRRQYVLERVGPSGVDYVVDFNVNWLDPGGEASRQWRQTYETLAARPNLEVAYLKRDRFGQPVFYVIRNHGHVNIAH